MSTTEWTYFQFHKDHKLPIYIRFDHSEFNSDLIGFLKKMKFAEVPVADVKKVEESIDQNGKLKVLTISLASNLVARQIEAVAQTDRYGLESIVAKEGYRVYRYKGNALLVYSLAADEWKLGCFSDFGNAHCFVESKIVINRFVSWAMSSIGMVGLWGVPVDEGIVVLSCNESQGEAVFIDLKNRKIFSQDGVEKFPARFKILRLDRTLKNRNIRMSPEELLSFLSTHTTYLDTSGLSVPVRQMLQSLSRVCDGLIHPKDSFQPRTDLTP